MYKIEKTSAQSYTLNIVNHSQASLSNDNIFME
jgi:hypothetical protein